MDRYFSETPLVTRAAITLEGSEAHHLSRVMRVSVGEQVELFDGLGSQFIAEITEVRKNEVALLVTEEQQVDRELPCPLTIAVALPKGERQKWLVEKLVELGVTELIPIVTERSVVQPNDKAVKRLQRGVIEASKQCRRNRLMMVGDVRTWNEIVADDSLATQRVIAHPYGDSAVTNLEAEPALVAVGPEGGFTDAEVKQATSSGWRVLNLGPRILRVETAAIACAARRQT